MPNSWRAICRKLHCWKSAETPSKCPDCGGSLMVRLRNEYIGTLDSDGKGTTLLQER